MTEQEREEYRALQKECHDLIDKLNAMRDERDMLQKKLDEELRYQEWCKENRIKGYASGYMTRCVGRFTVEHEVAEQSMKVRIALRKLANNPAIAPDVQQTLEKAAWYAEMYLEYRKRYFMLMDMDKKLRSLGFRKLMAERKKNNEQE